MRPSRFGVLFSSYWTGPTGRLIQAKGKDATILGLYLVSSKHANMIGLYELPLAYITADLPVLGHDVDTIAEALTGLQEVGFARYDYFDEVVWVNEMARIACWLEPGERLKPSDKRYRSVVHLYGSVKPSLLLEPFHDRYGEQLSLPVRRPNPTIEHPNPKPLLRPSQAPSERLGRPSEVREQRTVIREENSEQIRGVSHARASLIQRRRLTSAFEGDRLTVPQSLHAEFVKLRNRPDAEKELLTWYAAVNDDWSHGAHKDASPGGDMFRFWRDRYSEKWPAATTPTRKRPAWAVEAES